MDYMFNRIDSHVYYDGDVPLHGRFEIGTETEEILAPRPKDKRPVVLVCPDWSGVNAAWRTASLMTQFGYIGFAIDMYGEGKTGETKEEKTALVKPFFEDRALLRRRILAAYEAARKYQNADPDRIAVVGYCFGGMCALDLARSGADIKGAVSFHGLLNAPENLSHEKIKAKILVLHGHDDPMVKPEEVLAFENEMTQAHANWQVTVYGNTMHSFTNPEANDPDFGTVYNKQAADRSWIEMTSFLKEIFSDSDA
jgi:dienelactone hydrolase